MNTDTQPDTVSADLQRWLDDPLATNEAVDLDALEQGRFALHAQDAAQEAQIDATQEVAGQLLDAGQAAAGVNADTSADNANGNTGNAANEAPPASAQDAKNDAKNDVNEATDTATAQTGTHAPADPAADLATLRQRVAQAEALASELARENTALKAQPHTTPAPPAPVDEQTLAGLREDAPEVAEAVEKLLAQNRELAEQVHSREAAARQTEQQAYVQARIEAQVATEEAIASIPKLAHVRNTDPATFAAIAQIDTALMAQSAWQDRPLNERFSAALRAYEAAHGPLSVAQAAQPQPTQPATQPAPAPAAPATQPASAPPEQAAPLTAADVDKLVAAAIARAQGSIAPVQTLSDIHGGTAQPEDNRDALLDMSGVALTERLMNLPLAQINQTLARLA